MTVAEEFVRDHYLEGYLYVSNFLVAMMEYFRDATVGRVTALIPPLVAALPNEAAGCLKHRIYIGAAVSQILAEGIAHEQLDPVIQFVFDTFKLPTLDEEHAFKLLTMTMPLKASFDDARANRLFSLLLDRSLTTTDNEKLSGWINMCSKLLKRYAIEEEVLMKCVSAVLGGDFVFFKSLPPYRAVPTNVSLFKFLSGYIKKVPSKGLPILQTIISWLGNTAFEAVPSLLLPVKAGVSVGIVNEEMAKELGRIIIQLLEKLEKEDCVELMAVVGVATELFNHHPTSLDPIDNVLRLLVPFVQAAKGAEEEEEMGDEELIESMPTVCKFVFGVYASTSPPQTVNDDLLLGLVTLLPFPPAAEVMGDLLEDLNSLLEDREKFSIIVLPVLKMYTELLLMKKSEQEEFDFSDELIKNMKATSFTCYKTGRTLSRTIPRYALQKKLGNALISLIMRNGQ
jgi:hypothetical protein